VPDEEGQFMTCANVWYGGTYAIFGYWEKPEGWNSRTCADLPELPEGIEWEYYSSAAQFDWTATNAPFVILPAFPGVLPDFPGIVPPSSLTGTTGDRCSTTYPGTIETDDLFIDGVPYGPSGPGFFLDFYCACGSMYHLDIPFPPPANFD
jgi:hypothetical protein